MADAKRIRKTTTSEEDVYRCFYCDKKKHRTAFYKHTVYYNKSGITPICKQCANDMANRVEYGVANGVTIESMLRTLRIMDKPFIKALFETADQSSKDANRSAQQVRSVFGNYISGLSVSKYADSSWEDTEIASVKELEEEKGARSKARQMPADPTLLEDADINKKDCIRLIGYDPFLTEPEEDKPFLYAQMIKYLDASAESNEDAMKVSSIVQIVKSYHQASKIDAVISSITSDPKELLDNASVIRNLHSTQKTLMDTALSLAKDNGISFAHNSNNSKGANTLSGRLKKMRDLDLREIEVNGFDIGTAGGMKQVADISNASILSQIRLNENDIPEMIADQRILIEKWEKIAFKSSEQARILLRENQDLKAYIERIGRGDVLKDRSFILDDEGGVNSPDIYEDDYQEAMRKDGQGDIWSLDEDEVSEEVLGEDRLDAEYEEDADDIEVDPDDIVVEDLEETDGGGQS